MRYNNRKIGSEYEEMAIKFLEQEGYQVLEKNFRCHIGEIDIIARHGKYLVFIEVKYRKNSIKGDPAEAIHKGKQNTIYRTAQFYLHRFGYGQQTPCRFDAVLILGDQVRLIQNAFGGL